MDRQRWGSVAAAVLAVLFVATLASTWRKPQRDTTVVKLDRAGLEFCMQHAELLFDITWAAACYKSNDDNVDCTLPDARAAVINAAFNADRERCVAGAALAR